LDILLLILINNDMPLFIFK